MKKFSFYLLCTLLTSLFYSNSAKAVDNNLLTTLLKKHVKTNGLVDYKGIKADEVMFNNYLDILKTNYPKDSWTKNEKLSYWINVYNAFTLKLVIDNYPVKSILDINEGKPWDLSFIKIGDKSYSLNQVENDILRKDFNEPRIHFAINCASISCPNLLNKAFEPATLNEQLELVTKAFITNQSRNSITSTNVQISKIFDWFKADFEKAGGVIPFLNKYSKVKINSTPNILYKDYNWNLNQL